MRDVVFSADREGSEENSGGSDDHQVDNDMIDSSASKGKRRAFGSPAESETGMTYGSEDRSNEAPQEENMSSFDDAYMNAEDCDGGVEGMGDHDNDDDDRNVALASVGEHRTLIQILPAEPVDLPLQEFREGEDEEWDIGPERN